MGSKARQIGLGFKCFLLSLLTNGAIGVLLSWLLGVETREFLRLFVTIAIPMALLAGWWGRNGVPKGTSTSRKAGKGQ